MEKTDWTYIRATKRYAHDVYRLTSITTNTEAGWYLGVDDEVVYRIDKRMLVPYRGSEILLSTKSQLDPNSENRLWMRWN